MSKHDILITVVNIALNAIWFIVAYFYGSQSMKFKLTRKFLEFMDEKDNEIKLLKDKIGCTCPDYLKNKYKGHLKECQNFDLLYYENLTEKFRAFFNENPKLMELKK